MHWDNNVWVEQVRDQWRRELNASCVCNEHVYGCERYWYILADLAFSNKFFLSMLWIDRIIFFFFAKMSYIYHVTLQLNGFITLNTLEVTSTHNSRTNKVANWDNLNVMNAQNWWTIENHSHKWSIKTSLCYFGRSEWCGEYDDHYHHK